jgi:RHS repeat-associated protein
MTKKITSSLSSVSAVAVDSLGRASQAQAITPSGTVLIDTTYDSVGRVATVSNPYYQGSSHSSDPTYGTTQTQYDILNRVTQVRKQDGSTSTIAYNGNCSTVTDEAGKLRKSCSDALGRLTTVFEDPNGLNYVTDYQYDILDNLTRIDQKGSATSSSEWRTRTFTYDSLSELLTEKHPESGLTTYFYDADKDLSQKVSNSPNQTGSAQHTVTFCRDHGNRVTGKAYSWQNCPLPSGTAVVTYIYDQGTNGIGHLTGVTDQAGSGTYSYDVMGRLASQQRTNAGVASTVSYTYNLNGSIASLSYPSGRVVTYAYNAGAQLDQVQFASWNGTTVGYNYWAVNDSNFYPNAIPKAVSLGNSVVESTILNSRLQMQQDTVSNASIGALADHAYDYGTQNNGNILGVADQLNSSRTQNFTYDALNRLLSASESRWGLGYVYDAWGNYLQQNVIIGTSYQHQYTVANNNQLNGFPHDAAGNILNDGLHQYFYDPENRIIQVDNGAATYTYNVDGNRVRKDVMGSPSTEYIYSGSNVIAERNITNGAWSDYIYNDGKRIAKADSFKNEIKLQGTNTATGQYTWWSIVGAPQVPVRAGDKLYFLQYQQAAEGGIIMGFQDGSNSSWGVVDQDGSYANVGLVLNQWHGRVVDLTQYAGKTITSFSVGNSSAAPVGSWSILYAEIVVKSSDGTIYPVYTGQNSTSFVAASNNTPGVTGLLATTITDTTAGANTALAEQYYHGDQIGSSRLMTSAGGWPVWQATFLPYGEEYNPQITTNHYKFTGKERDAETGLDEFPARYYGSNLGRWMTPDPLRWIDWQQGNREEREKFVEFLGNPQNLNLYAYVDNNPESRDDPTGMQGCQAGDKKFTICTINVVYDKKTSKGTLIVTGQNKGDKKPTVLLTSSVVVGGNGHVTPTGTFTATVWEKDHVSTKYGNAANTPWSKTLMGGNAFGPYQLHIKELDSRGIFIHGTMGPSWSPVTWGNSIFLSSASHGCVRMCNSDNIKLHNMMPNPGGNKVIITQDPGH